MVLFLVFLTSTGTVASASLLISRLKALARNGAAQDEGEHQCEDGKALQNRRRRQRDPEDFRLGLGGDDGGGEDLALANADIEQCDARKHADAGVGDQRQKQRVRTVAQAEAAFLPIKQQEPLRPHCSQPC